jgi:hypothetical protein
LAEAWWTQIGRLGMLDSLPEGKKINASLWIFNMKNRFGWADRNELEMSGALSTDRESIDISGIVDKVREELDESK